MNTEDREFVRNAVMNQYEKMGLDFVRLSFNLSDSDLLVFAKTVTLETMATFDTDAKRLNALVNG